MSIKSISLHSSHPFLCDLWLSCTYISVSYTESCWAGSIWCSMTWSICTMYVNVEPHTSISYQEKIICNKRGDVCRIRLVLRVQRNKDVTKKAIMCDISFNLSSGSILIFICNLPKTFECDWASSRLEQKNNKQPLNMFLMWWIRFYLDEYANRGSNRISNHQ